MKIFNHLFLIVFLINTVFSGAAIARPQNDDRIKKIKAKVSEINNKTNKQIVVKLKDGSKLKGVLTVVGDQSFNISVAKSGQATEIYFADVKDVSKGGGLSTTSKIFIGFGIGAAALVALVIAGLSRLD